MTGPATVKSLAPTPVTSPSERASMAVEATAFAKPVMGTRVPAPANFAISSNLPKPVRSTATRIRVTDAIMPESSSGRPAADQSTRRAWPAQQMIPPTVKARAQFCKTGDFFARFSAYLA